MEQRRLFGFGKRQSSKGKHAVKTCTLKFVYLASKDDEGPPSSVKQRTDLSNAGLGDGNISFVLDGTTVYNGIMEKFPKLRSVGGFDLMLFQRGGGEDGGFHRIMPPHTRLVRLFAINRTTIPRIYSCSELVCAIVDLGIVGLSVMCAHCGHNFFYLFV